jgi:hypothetical protein
MVARLGCGIAAQKRHPTTESSMEQHNLTDQLAIKHALERKLGHGAVKKIADLCGVHIPTVSNVMSGRRRNRVILTAIAKTVEQPVRGVCPDGTDLPENMLADVL